MRYDFELTKAELLEERFIRTYVDWCRDLNVKSRAQAYGRRIYSIGDYITKGINTIEIKVVTTMGNYMKSLTDNPTAQYWTNEKNKIQPLQSMGLIGPVTLY